VSRYSANSIRWLGGLLLAGTVSACGAVPDEAVAEQPGSFDDELELRVPLDLSSDPNVLEIDLEARVSNVELVAGTTTPAWTYDGAIPGPLLRAKVGDRLIVHFKNSLPEATTIHWHGLRIPADQDGVPGHGQAPVEPGGRVNYTFTLPDAGTYWYHPHFDSAAQVANGLYGPIIVEDPAEPEGLGDEVVMMLSDIAVGADGALLSNEGGGDLGTLFGREGNLLLVNGRVNPAIHARSGLRQRWRVINAAQSRYFQLALPGTSFVRIGGDGGLAASPEVSTSPVVVPAGRADFLVEPRSPSGNAGTLPLLWVPYDRGFGTAYARDSETVLHIDFDGQPPASSAALPQLTRELPELDREHATPVDLALTLNNASDGSFALGINGVPSWQADHLMARLGETQLWTVRNTIEWDHPFHLHGFFFRVLDVNGVAPRVSEWSDTANVPVDGALRLLVKFDERPGMWMFHCHILDHADAGMMGMVLLQ
jgi:FtsP/CotA-like multicopper oxidase with cupredoxin domain